MINNILAVSASTSVVILLALLLDKFLSKRIKASWRRILWLIIALRLVIPFTYEIKSAPPVLPEVDYDAVVRLPAAPQVTKDIEMNNPESYAPVLSVGEIIGILWAIGAAAVMIYYIGGYIIFRIRIKPHLRKCANVYICAETDAPIMTGFFKPIIIIPDKSYTPEELELIVLHEKTHIKHLDIWYKLLLAAAKAMHWFNPLVYVLCSKAQRDIEFSCDDKITENINPENKRLYMMTILKSAERNEKND